MSGPAESSPPPSAAAVPRTVRAVRRRPRWGLRLATAASVLVLAACGAGRIALSGFDTGIGRVDTFHGLSDRPRGSDGSTFLVVGTDARERLSRADRSAYHLGGVPCHCTDTIMLIHLSGDRRRASVVSIPRDSYTVLPGSTDPVTGRRLPPRPEKLNAAYARGGPQLTVRTVEHMTRVHIDHYVEVDFTGFMRTVDLVGGVDVCTPTPMHDDHTGLDLPAGTSRLGGGAALQYVRSRHVDGAADLARMQRQQRFLASLVHRVTGSGVLTNPVRFHQVATALLGSVRADREFDADDLVALGRALRGFTPASSEFASVPLADPAHRVPGLGSTVTWDEERAAELFRAIREDRPLAGRRSGREREAVVEVPPAQVRVQVDNGTHTSGLGSSVDRALRAAGFATTGTPGSAVPSGAATTEIAYDPGWDRSARTLGAALPGARLRAVPGLGARMRVTLGDPDQRVAPVRTAQAASKDGNRFAAVTGDQVACP